jgi:histidinol phosphatase-like enzyme
MVWKAQEEFLIDLSTSLMIGDKGSDVLSLLNLPTYILQEQYSVKLDEDKQEKANIFNNLASLVNHLLA